MSSKMTATTAATASALHLKTKFIRAVMTQWRRFVKNLLVAAAGAALIVVAGAQTAAAAPPVGSCPKPASGFRLYTIEELLPTFTSPGTQEFLEATDNNDDGFLCTKDLPDTPGNPPTARIVLDNSARR